jgi:hypothetical protein
MDEDRYIEMLTEIKISIARLEERVKGLQDDSYMFNEKINKIEASSCSSISGLLYWVGLVIIVFITPIIQHVIAK